MAAMLRGIRATGRPGPALCSAVVLAMLTGCAVSEPLPAAAQSAPHTKPEALAPAAPRMPAEEECARISGRLVEGQQAAVSFRMGASAFGITLPGQGWCEIRMGPAYARVFVNVGPRVDARRANRNASPWDMDFVAVQVAPYADARGVGGAADLRERLRRIIEAYGGGRSGGFLDLTRRPGVRTEIGEVEPGNSCVPLRIAGELPAGLDPTTGTNAPHARRFVARARFCLAPPPLEGAALIVVLHETTAADRTAQARTPRYDALAEAVTGSLVFGAAPVTGAAPQPLREACRAAAQDFDTTFPQLAARLGVTPDPGAVGSIEVAMGLLVALVDSRIPDEDTRRLCFREVLEARRFGSPPTLDEARRMLGAGRPTAR
jgi:hypothetical protein